MGKEGEVEESGTGTQEGGSKEKSSMSKPKKDSKSKQKEDSKSKESEKSREKESSKSHEKERSKSKKGGGNKGRTIVAAGALGREEPDEPPKDLPRSNVRETKEYCVFAILGSYLLVSIGAVSSTIVLSILKV